MAALHSDIPQCVNSNEARGNEPIRGEGAVTPLPYANEEPHPAQTVWPYSTPLTSQLTLQGRTIAETS